MGWFGIPTTDWAKYSFGAGVPLLTNYLGSRAQGQAADQQLAYARQQQALDQARYDQQLRLSAAQWEARERLLAPYRQAAASILSQSFGGVPVDVPAPTNLGDLIGKKG